MVYEDTLMVEVRFNRNVEVRYHEDASRLSPGRLTGTLMTYEQRASDRPELFARRALIWTPRGITINEQHNRQQTIIRAVPFVDGDNVNLDTALPDTQRGRDAAISVRNGTYTGLSVEFKVLEETMRSGLRVIKRAVLVAAGLVDDPSYGGSTVEVRGKGISDSDMERYYRWL